jgi:hypothetical protein
MYPAHNTLILVDLVNLVLCEAEYSLEINNLLLEQTNQTTEWKREI